MTLRQKLTEQAEIDLANMITELHSASHQYKGVENRLLLKLVLGGRVASVRTKAIKQLVDQAEAEIFEKYSNQQQLDLSDSDKADSL